MEGASKWAVTKCNWSGVCILAKADCCHRSANEPARTMIANPTNMTMRGFVSSLRSRLIGVSTNRYDSDAMINEVMTSSRRFQPSCRSINWAPSNNTGQCHRYHEYETRPMACMGLADNQRPAYCHPTWELLPNSTNAVPQVGSNAQ